MKPIAGNTTVLEAPYLAVDVGSKTFELVTGGTSTTELRGTTGARLVVSVALAVEPMVSVAVSIFVTVI